MNKATNCTGSDVNIPRAEDNPTGQPNKPNFSDWRKWLYHRLKTKTIVWHKAHTALTGMKRSQRGNVQGWNSKHRTEHSCPTRQRDAETFARSFTQANNEKNEKHCDSESNLLPTLENSFLLTSFFTPDKKQACVFRLLQCWLPHSDMDYCNQTQFLHSL